MPNIFYYNGFRFFFYANEGDEPMHVHVEKGECTAKVWLEPIEYAKCKNFNHREQRAILEIIFERRQEIMEVWNDFFKLN